MLDTANPKRRSKTIHSVRFSDAVWHLKSIEWDVMQKTPRNHSTTRSNSAGRNSPALFVVVSVGAPVALDSLARLLLRRASEASQTPSARDIDDEPGSSLPPQLKRQE